MSAPRSINSERVTAFAFHPDGKSWLFGTSKGVTFYDAKTQQVRRELRHKSSMGRPPGTLRVSANGNTLVIKGRLSAPQVLDVRDQDHLGVARNLSVREEDGREIVTPVFGLEAAFALGPDGRLFAQSLPDGAIVLWNFGQRRSLGQAFDLEHRRNIVEDLRGRLGLGAETPS